MEPGANYGFSHPYVLAMTARSKSLLAALLALISLALCAGCVGPRSDAATIPWAQPATWEGQIPGMGAGPGGY